MKSLKKKKKKKKKKEREGERVFQFSVSAEDEIMALGKAYTGSAPSLSTLLKIALETVPIVVCLNKDRSRPRSMKCRLLPLSTPLSFKRSVVCCSGLYMFRKFLKHRSTSALPSCRPDISPAALVSLSARSFQLTPACPGQKIHRSLYSRRHCMAMC